MVRNRQQQNPRVVVVMVMLALHRRFAFISEDVNNLLRICGTIIVHMPLKSTHILRMVLMLPNRSFSPYFCLFDQRRLFVPSCQMKTVQKQYLFLTKCLSICSFTALGTVFPVVDASFQKACSGVTLNLAWSLAAG